MTLRSQELDRARQLRDAGVGYDTIATLAFTSFGRRLSVDELRQHLDGGYLRGIALPYGAPHRRDDGTTVMFTRSSLRPLPPALPLLIDHDPDRQVGKILSHRHTAIGLDVEAWIDPAHLDEVRPMLPCGWSVGRYYDPDLDEPLGPDLALEHDVRVDEVSLTAEPAYPTHTGHLRTRSIADELLAEAQIDRVRRRVGDDPLTRRLTRLGVASRPRPPTSRPASNS